MVEKFTGWDIHPLRDSDRTDAMVFVRAADYDALAAELAAERNLAETNRAAAARAYAAMEARIARLESALALQKEILAKYHKLNCTAAETPEAMHARIVTETADALAAELARYKGNPELQTRLEWADVRIRKLEAALGEIASRTDWTRDDCGKAAHDACFPVETKGEGT